jgi:hypothetical protein
MADRLLERLSVVPAIVPIDCNAAAQDGDWVNLKANRRILVVVFLGAWAGGTPALTFRQAKDNAGGSAKALSYTERWDGTALTTDVPTKTTVTSDTSNLVATANTFYQVEFHAQDLDIANGFTHIQVRVASPGANADLIAALYILGDPEYTRVPNLHTTVIA